MLSKLEIIIPNNSKPHKKIPMFFTHIYILTTPQLPGRYKIGISRNVPARVGQIAGELAATMGCTVRVKKWVSFPVFFPGMIERTAHRLFAGVSAKVPFHHGHTEWFRSRNILALLFFLAFLAFMGKAMTFGRLAVAAVLYFVRWPLDATIVISGLVAAHLAVISGLLWIIFNPVAGWLAALNF